MKTTTSHMLLIPFDIREAMKTAEQCYREGSMTDDRYSVLRAQWSALCVAAFNVPVGSDPTYSDEFCMAIGEWVFNFHNFIKPI